MGGKRRRKLGKANTYNNDEEALEGEGRGTGEEGMVKSMMRGW